MKDTESFGVNVETSIKKPRVRLDFDGFGEPEEAYRLSPKMARRLAESLLESARRAERFAGQQKESW